MNLKISEIQSKFNKVTFSKSTDEIRLKWGSTPLYDDIKEDIYSLIKGIEDFYLKSDLMMTLRGQFNIKEDSIDIYLKDNGRHKRNNIVYARFSSDGTLVTLTESYRKYLKEKRNGK